MSFFKVCLTETCQTGLTGSSPLFAQHYHLSVERKEPLSSFHSILELDGFLTVLNHSHTSSGTHVYYSDVFGGF